MHWLFSLLFPASLEGSVFQSAVVKKPLNVRGFFSSLREIAEFT